MTRLKTLVPAAACIAVLAAPAAALAGAAPKYRVTVEGTQTTTWKDRYQAQGRCDSNGEGSGKETITFRTTPLTFKATKLGPTLIMWGTAQGHAKVNRNGHVDVDPTPPECEGTDGRPGGTPQVGPKPDCGVKRDGFLVGIRYENVLERGKPSGFSIAGSNGQAGYKNCPVAGTAFPNLLDFTTGGDQILAPIEVDELLDKSVGKHIIRGQGTRKQHVVTTASVTDYKTKIRWEITLRRVKG